MDLKIVKTYASNDLAEPDKVIERMEGSWQAAYRNTQLALVATLVTLHQHGDRPTAVTRANRIVNAVKIGGNSKAVVEWLSTFGFVMGDDAVAEAPDRATIEERCKGPKGGFQKAKELMWWTLKPQNPFKGWNLQAVLMKAVADAAKFEKVANDEPDKADVIDIDPVLLAGVQHLLEAVGE